MKMQSLVAACLGSVGVLLAALGGFDAAGGMMLAVGSYRSTPGFMTTMAPQFLGICAPFLVGLAFLFFAARLARLICRFARIGDLELPILNDATALTLGCLVTGLVL